MLSLKRRRNKFQVASPLYSKTNIGFRATSKLQLSMNEGYLSVNWSK